MSGHRKGHHIKRRAAKDYGDNPSIRRGHERSSISLAEEWEVQHAAKVGAIKVGKSGSIKPVKGKAYVRNGHIYYA